MTGDSFNFGTKNSVDDWGIQVIATDTFLPPKRERKQRIPGRHGAHDFGARNWDERILRVECRLLREMSKAEFREVVYWLSKKARLSLWNEPDKYYMAELYDAAEVLDYYCETMRDFELEFVCEPFAYGRTVTLPLHDGRNAIEYGGTADAPCVVVLRNASQSNITNIKLTVIKRS